MAYLTDICGSYTIYLQRCRFPFDHYHSNTHEVLVPYQGTAELVFGHSSSTTYIKHCALPGDVYLIPAGVAHRSLTSSSDFKMVGSYPVGSRDWDNCRGEEGAKVQSWNWERVKKLGQREHWPSRDPIYGDAKEAPLFKFWTGSCA